MSETRVECGATDPCDWKQDGDDLTVAIDTSGHGFSKTPTYLCSLVGESHHWSTTGGSCVVDPRSSGFTVRVRNALGKIKCEEVCYLPLELGIARKQSWRINWIALEEKQ